MRSVVHSDGINTMKDVIRVFVAQMFFIITFNSIRKAFATNARMKRSVVHSNEFNTMGKVIRVFAANLLLLRKELLPQMHE